MQGRIAAASRIRPEKNRPDRGRVIRPVYLNIVYGLYWAYIALTAPQEVSSAGTVQPEITSEMVIKSHQPP